MERSVKRTFMSMLRTFFSAKSFRQISESSNTLLRKLRIRIVIYLDDNLLIAASPEELLIARDTLIFLLPNWGLLINAQKSILDPTSILEFLGVSVDSQNMT